MTFSGIKYLGTSLIRQHVDRIDQLHFGQRHQSYQRHLFIERVRYNGFYNSSTFGASPITAAFYPFQTVGGGDYYLANGCGVSRTRVLPALIRHC